MSDGIQYVSSGERTLRLFLDERGTGFDLDYFVVGGVAVLGKQALANAEQQWDLWVGRESLCGKKATKWDPGVFESFARLVIATGLHPVACHCRMHPTRKALAKQRARSLPSARERGGLPAMEDKKISGFGSLYVHMVAPTVLQALSSLALNLGRVRNVGVVLDRQKISAFEEEVLRGNVGKLVGPVLRDSLRGVWGESSGPRSQARALKLEARRVFSWRSSPSVHFRARDPLLAMADAYCAMVGRFLEGVDGAIAGMRLLEDAYTGYATERPAPYLLHDLEHLIDQLLDRGWGSCERRMRTEARSRRESDGF